MSVLAPLKVALGLSEEAKPSQVRQAIHEALMAEMTPEEQAEMEKEEALEKERMKKMMMSDQAIRTTLKLDDKADVVAAVQALAGGDISLNENQRLSQTVKDLTDRVLALEPKAAVAERLEQQAKDAARNLFFSEQIRLGKLAPVEKAFYEQMWATSEAEVRKFFDGKKPQSSVKLAEVGSALGGPLPADDEDPRETLRQLAEQRAVDKSIGFVEALTQVKVERPELSEAVASMYGPAGLRR